AVEVEGFGEYAHLAHELLEALTGVARQIESLVGTGGDDAGIGGMHGETVQLPAQSLGRSALPPQAGSTRLVDAGMLHARVRVRVEYVHRVGPVAGRQRVEIRLAFEPEFLPCFSSVLALDEAERIRQSGARRWMAAAVQRIACRREAHVVVCRSCSPR